MPKVAPAAVRLALVERAAEMLARREPVTLRALVEGTGASTMAVYTHFGGMPGLRGAVRQEGFTRLAARLALLTTTSDAVRDLAALGAAYIGNALDHPDLYRVMFEAEVDLVDAAAADGSFGLLVSAADRARQAGRFTQSSDPHALATRLWAGGHGLSMLAISGVLPPEALDGHGQAIAAALFMAAGDRPDRCRASVRRGWAAGVQLRPRDAAGTEAPRTG